MQMDAEKEISNTKTLKEKNLRIAVSLQILIGGSITLFPLVSVFLVATVAQNPASHVSFATHVALTTAWVAVVFLVPLRYIARSFLARYSIVIFAFSSIVIVFAACLPIWVVSQFGDVSLAHYLVSVSAAILAVFFGSIIVFR